jgi:hypothetical protein
MIAPPLPEALAVTASSPDMTDSTAVWSAPPTAKNEMKELNRKMEKATRSTPKTNCVFGLQKKSQMIPQFRFTLEKKPGSPLLLFLFFAI